MPIIDIVETKWCTGKTEPTFIFAQVGDEPSDIDDSYIGMMKTIQIAREAVAAHNARLESRNDVELYKEILDRPYEGR